MSHEMRETTTHFCLEEENPKLHGGIAIGEALDFLCPESLSSLGLPAYHRVYTRVPLPVLTIPGIGVIPLPLNARRIHALRQQRGCATSPGIEETAGHDTKSLRYDSKEFAIANPAWESFMEQIARETCEVLGIDYQANAPSCKLLELSVETSGTILQSPQYSASYDGLTTLANILLVLPSRYAGGSLQIAYKDHCFLHNLGSSTVAGILALAWRPEASLRMEPLTSGSRTVLSLALVATSPHPTPPLPIQVDALAQMHNVFSTWQQARRRDAPTKLVRLLDRKYNRANVRKTALRGTDVRFVSVLAEFARMYSFGVGLAVLACRLRGERVDSDDLDEGDDSSILASDESAEESEDSHSMGSDEIKDEDEDNTDHLHNSQNNKADAPSSKRLVTLADFDGNVLQEHVHCDDDTQVYPIRLRQTLSSTRSDRLFDDLPAWTRPFAVVIWPSWADFDLAQGLDAFCAACERLTGAPMGDRPSAEQQELVDLILARANPNPSSRAQVVNSVCRAACAWHDVSLWGRALDACGAGATVESGGFDEFCDAVKAFGFVNVQARIETAVERDPSDLAALQFLRDFEVWMTVEMANDHESGPERQWLASQRHRRLQGVHAEVKQLLSDLQGVDAAELTSIVAIAAVGGEPSIVFEEIVPAIADSNADLARELISALVDEMLDRKELLDGVGDKMPAALSCLLHKYTASIDLRGLPNSDIPPRVADALEYCLCRGVPDACGSLLCRVVHCDQASSADIELEVDKHYVKTVLVPVLEHTIRLAEEYHARMDRDPFAPFVRAVLSLWATAVLGPLPAHTAATLARVERMLEAWECACEHCATVKAWLGEEPEAVMTYERIGGAKRKHLEKFLRAWGEGLVSWDAVMTSPQGVEVTKTDAVAASVGWRAHVKDGLRLLRSLHLDAGELGTVLGEEARAIVQLFLGRSTTPLHDNLVDSYSVVEALSALLLATPESIVAQLPRELEPSVPSPAEPPALALPDASSSSAGTDSNAAPESSQTVGPATRTRRSRTSSSRPEEGRGEPRRKRRKTTYDDDDEVIDLT